MAEIVPSVAVTSCSHVNDGIIIAGMIPATARMIADMLITRIFTPMPTMIYTAFLTFVAIFQPVNAINTAFPPQMAGNKYNKIIVKGPNNTPAANALTEGKMHNNPKNRRGYLQIAAVVKTKFTIVPTSNCGSRNKNGTANAMIIWKNMPEYLMSARVVMEAMAGSVEMECCTLLAIILESFLT